MFNAYLNLLKCKFRDCVTNMKYSMLTQHDFEFHQIQNLFTIFWLFYLFDSFTYACIYLFLKCFIKFWKQLNVSKFLLENILIQKQTFTSLHFNFIHFIHFWFWGRVSQTLWTMWQLLSNIVEVIWGETMNSSFWMSS